MDASTCEQYAATPISVQWRPSFDQDESESMKRLFAVGHIDGEVQLCSANFSGVHPHVRPAIQTQWKRKHKKAVRRVRFDERDGTRLYSISSNRALVEWDVETGAKTRCLKTAHEHPPYSLCAISPSATKGQTVATGDECGFVRTWDMRSTDPCVTNHLLVPKDDDAQDALGEEVTDMCLSKVFSQLHLLATSGDGTLTAIDLRSRKLLMRSEMMDHELLSVTADAQGQTYCGSSNNMIEIFKHNSWGNIVSRLRPRHVKGATIDCVRSVKLMPHILLSSSALDGNIRIHRTTPSKTVQCVGSHEEGVEELSTTDDGGWMVSCGFDDRVKIWSMRALIQAIPVSYSKKAVMDDGDSDEEPGRKKRKKGAPRDSFFDGLAESTSVKKKEEVPSDDDDSDDEGEEDRDEDDDVDDEEGDEGEEEDSDEESDD